MADLQTSHVVVAWWCVIASIVALLRPLPGSRRLAIVSGAVALLGTVFAVSRVPWAGAGAAIRTLAPAVWVVAAYWIASAYFVAPQAPLERWLGRVDDALLSRFRRERRGTRGAAWAAELLELAYLAVYATVPTGAWAAWEAGGLAAVDAYWLLVFPSVATCYLSLAWGQTRPPRHLERSACAGRRSALRRANEFVLQHGSHGVNTVPSGHAAGAVAVALSLGGLGSPWAPLFWLLAAAILVATVAGRYHFVVDTALGALVAVVCWAVVRVVS